jgi:hypothetical protein
MQAVHHFCYVHGPAISAAVYCVVSVLVAAVCLPL